MPDYAIKSDFSSSEWNNLILDLNQFGTRGHEWLQVVEKDGKQYVSTTAKPRAKSQFFRWLISWFYKPKNLRVEQINQCFVQFIKANAVELARSATEFDDQALQSRIKQSNPTYNELSRINHLRNQLIKKPDAVSEKSAVSILSKLLDENTICHDLSLICRDGVVKVHFAVLKQFSGSLFEGLERFPTRELRLPEREAEEKCSLDEFETESQKSVAVTSNYSKSIVEMLMTRIYGKRLYPVAETLNEHLQLLNLAEELLLVQETAILKKEILYVYYRLSMVDKIKIINCLHNPSSERDYFLSHASEFLIHTLFDDTRFTAQVSKLDSQVAFQFFENINRYLGDHPFPSISLSVHTGLGFCHYYGIGTPRDMVKALENLEIAKGQNDPYGLFLLGLYYERGDDLTKDLSKAASLYQAAANHGHSLALVFLGYCYEKGRGVSKDIGKAVALYQQAANQEQPVGLTFLGTCYEAGIGVIKDLSKAASLYQAAADLGFPID